MAAPDTSKDELLALRLALNDLKLEAIVNGANVDLRSPAANGFDNFEVLSQEYCQLKQRLEVLEKGESTSHVDVPTAVEGAGENPDKVLYITVGPQCAGKTTYLSKLPGQVLDIAIDDWDGLISKKSVQNVDPESQARICADALLSPEEIPRDELSKRIALSIRSKMPQHLKDRHAASLTDAVYAVRQERAENGVVSFSPTLDMMVFQNMRGAINGTIARLKDELAKGTPAVAWGNTNSKLADMYNAVMFAEENGYQIKFVRLDSVPFDELLRRNLKRMAASGKFIPVEVMAMTATNVHNMLERHPTDEELLKAVVATKGNRK